MPHSLLIKIGYSAILSIIFLIAAFQAMGGDKLKRHPVKNSLVIIFFCWATLPIAVALGDKLIEQTTLFIFWNALVWIAIIVAICIAITSSLNFEEGDSQEKSSQRLSRKTFMLIFLFAGLFGYFVYSHNPNMFQRFLGNQPSEDETIKFNPYAFTKKYDSPNYFFSIQGAYSNWSLWTDANRVYPDTEFALQQEESSAYFVVVPFFLEDGMPDTEIFTKASMPFIELEPDDAWKGKWERHQQHGFEGYTFNFEKNVADAAYEYQVKTLHNDKLGYLIASWAKKSGPEADMGNTLRNMHNRTRITYQEGASEYPGRDAFTKSDNKRHSKMYMNIGQEYLKAEKYDKGMRYLKKAHEGNIYNSEALGSILYGLIKQNKQVAAKGYLEKYLNQFPESMNLYEHLLRQESPERDELLDRATLDEKMLKELVKSFKGLPFPELMPLEPLEDISFDSFERDSDMDTEGSEFEEERKKKASLKNRFASNIQRQQDNLTSQKEQSARYLKLIRKINFEVDQPLTMHELQSIKIDRRSAILYFQSLYFPYDKSSEDVTVHSVIVRDRQNQVVFSAKPNDISFLESSSENEKSMINVNLPELKVGYSIESEITWTSKRELEEMGFFEYGFATTLLADQHEFHFIGNQDVISYKATSDVKTSAGKGEIQWTYHTPPEVTEPSQITARIWIGDKNKSWEEEGIALAKKLQSRMVNDPSLKEFSLSLTKRAKNKRDKIKILSDYVKQSINLDPHPMSLIDSLRSSKRFDFTKETSGDSLFLSLYLKSMLNAVGIKSYPALIRRDGLLQPEIPALEQFDFTLLHIHDFEDLPFVDPSDKTPKNTKIADKYSGIEAFVLNPENPFFIRLKPKR